MFGKAFITLVAAVLFGSPAFGADAFVVAMNPGVSVNQGAGYKGVETLREVKAGDQVMVNATGQGWIVYCGCDEELQPDQVYTVEERECKVQTVSLNRSNLPHAVLTGEQREEQELRRCGAVAGGWYLLAIPAVAAGVYGLASIGDDDGGGNGGALSATPTPASP